MIGALAWLCEKMQITVRKKRKGLHRARTDIFTLQHLGKIGMDFVKKNMEKESLKKIPCGSPYSGDLQGRNVGLVENGESCNGSHRDKFRISGL